MKLSMVCSRLASSMIVLCVLASTTQCSPPPPAPSTRGEEWRLAATHENVSLLSTIAGSSEYPAWSPDGTSIVFQHTEDRFGSLDFLAPRDIYVIDRDGSKERRLTEDMGSCEHPSWAPDSKRVVFSCKDGDDYDLYIADTATGTVVQLTDYPGDEKCPAWSPDGGWIAFASPMETEEAAVKGTVDITPTTVVTLVSTSSIYIVNSDGTQFERLTSGPVDRMPTWSPDGQKVGFTSSQDGSFVASICVVNRHGANRMCYEGKECSIFEWSPDGTHIACAYKRGMDLVEMDTRETMVLFQVDRDLITGLSWSPDGRQLVFTAGPESEVANDLYLLDLSKQSRNMPFK